LGNFFTPLQIPQPQQALRASFLEKMQYEYLKTAEVQVDAWLAEAERAGDVTYGLSSAAAGAGGSSSAAVAAAAREQTRAAEQRRRLLLPSKADEDVRIITLLRFLCGLSLAFSQASEQDGSRGNGQVAATGAAGALTKAMLRDRQKAIKRAVEEGSDEDSGSDADIVS